MSNYKPVTHVLFDLDGVLLNTEHVYEQIISDIAAQYGKTYPAEVRMKVLGTTEQRTSEIACRELGLPITAEEFLTQMRQRGETLLTDVDLLPGAKALIEHLHCSGVPIALATSSSAASVELKTTHHRELFSRFHHKVMGSSDPEVKVGKPHPDIYLICARRFSDPPLPEQCLVIEDAPNGVLSGKAAGMQVVMVPEASLDTALTAQATQVLTSLTHFQPELYGLPAFKETS